MPNDIIPATKARMRKLKLMEMRKVERYPQPISKPIEIAISKRYVNKNSPMPKITLYILFLKPLVIITFCNSA